MFRDNHWEFFPGMVEVLTCVEFERNEKANNWEVLFSSNTYFENRNNTIIKKIPLLFDKYKYVLQPNLF